jgi:nucleotide-binding universal stress UspA family protein
MPVHDDVVIAGVALAHGDAAATGLAAALAGALGARLRLVHAHPYDPLIAVIPPDWERRGRARAASRLEAMATQLPPGLNVSVQVRANPSPVRALHEAAEELGARMLVVAGTHRHGVAAIAPGGVGERLLHAAPCAVAIAPREATSGPVALRRVGVAFADGPEGEAALALAVELARNAGGSVRAITAADRPTPHAERVVERARSSIPADILAGAELHAGRPAEVLRRMSGELDILICGSRGYGPIRSLLLGGVTSTLAHTTACPLLIVPRAAGALREATARRLAS